MTAGNAWKRRFETLFAPISTVHESWLSRAITGQTALLDAAVAGRTARRLLRRYLPVPGEEPLPRESDTVPAWAKLDARSQRRLVLRLGAIACAAPIRRSVAKADLDLLRDAIGEKIHLEALAEVGVLVDVDLGEDYRRALETKRLRSFFIGVGLGILLSGDAENRPYVAFRLRYLFPASAWPARRTFLEPNEKLLARLLQQGSDD